MTDSSVSVSLMTMCETSTWMTSGMSPGSASTSDLAVLLGEHAALGHAGGVVGAEQLDRDRRLDGDVHADAQQVGVHDVAADRVALEVLDHDVLGRARADRDLEHGARVRERVAQGEGVDRERDRFALAAVDHAGNAAGAAQAAHRARTLL